MSAREITELKRTIAQLDKAYTDACMDKRASEVRVDALVDQNKERSAKIEHLDAQVTSLYAKLNEAEVSCGQYRDSAVEAEQLMQAVERDLDAADVEIAALKAANELVTREKAELSSDLAFEKGLADELGQSLAEAQARWDDADDELVELRATIARLQDEKSELSAMLDHDRVVYVEGVRDRNSLWAENRRLRDVIVHQAALLAGCGE
jgi:chromosome segregation ATPase